MEVTIVVLTKASTIDLAIRWLGLGERYANEILPTQIWGGKEVRDAFIKIGFGFYGPTDEYPAMQFARIPIGWEIVQCEKVVWFNILDAQKRVRADFYCKLNYSEATLRIVSRYRPTTNLNHQQANQEAVGIVIDEATKTEIFRSDPIPFPDKTMALDADAQARNLAEIWLGTSYPLWRDPVMYW